MLVRALLLSVTLFSTVIGEEPPIITPVLIAQLGNQLFQIAAAESLAIENNAQVVIPELKTEKGWDVPVNAEKILWRIKTETSRKPVNHYKEPVFTYQPIPYKPDMSLYGYFQSEKYFKKHKNEIIELFQPSQEILDYLTKKYPEIIQHPYSVAVHVRTYSKKLDSPKYYYLNGRQYVDNAMSVFPHDALFVVFSDDIKWAKKHLAKLRPNMLFIENEPHYHDFYLMSLCKHNIISNSTFSWWAAYINKNPRKLVIAPKKWFRPNLGVDYKDIYPEDWLVM